MIGAIGVPGRNFTTAPVLHLALSSGANPPFERQSEFSRLSSRRVRYRRQPEMKSPDAAGALRRAKTVIFHPGANLNAQSITLS